MEVVAAYQRWDADLIVSFLSTGLGDSRVMLSIFELLG
jgi:hypothetical protein